MHWATQSAYQYNSVVEFLFAAGPDHPSDHIRTLTRITLAVMAHTAASDHPVTTAYALRLFVLYQSNIIVQILFCISLIAFFVVVFYATMQRHGQLKSSCSIGPVIVLKRDSAKSKRSNLDINAYLEAARRQNAVGHLRAKFIAVSN